MKFKVCFLKPKKKKGHYSEQQAIFYTIEDASFYENEIKKRGAKQVQIIPDLS